MIQYIENTAEGSILYQEGAIVKLTMSNLSYIKKKCLESLFTYEGYLKAVQKKIGLKYKVPVYIDDATRMIPTKRVRDYDNIWINYASIRELIERLEGTDIIFYGNRQIHLKNSYKTLKKQIDELERIRFIKVKHFHS
jgi:competence transcription factor ComK